MSRLITENLIPFIIAMTGLLAAITALVVQIRKAMEEARKRKEAEKNEKKKEEKEWGKLTDHPLLPALLAMMNRTIPENVIISDLKRKMVEDSLKLRMRGWYNAFMLMIAHNGQVEGGYILSSGKILSDWYYGIIKSMHMEQIEKFPKKYVDSFSAKYISKIGETTSRGCGEIYDNHNDIYQTDFDKMWAMMTLTQDTLSFLYTIAVETANEMNGELEAELQKRRENA